MCGKNGEKRKKKRCDTGLCHVGCARMAGHRVIKRKDYCVSEGRSHGGSISFGPGFSPPWCRAPLSHLPVFHPLPVFERHAIWHFRHQQLTMELLRNTQRWWGCKRVQTCSVMDS